jgi:glycosyltransferase involved in cell wall biosynthesis
MKIIFSNHDGLKNPYHAGRREFFGRKDGSMIDLYYKPTLTIGIPAFNEEENIGRLLSDLAIQKQENHRLEEILVISDGSDDNTPGVVEAADCPKLRLIRHQERGGKNRRVNEIIRQAKSDVLILLDADIRIFDRSFADKIVQPFAGGKADLVSCRLLELPGRGFFEKMINISYELKREIFENYRGGVNVFTCRGPVRALSRRFYRKLKFPPLMVAEDIYSFLECLKRGYSYQYLKDPVVFYRSPQNLSDHQKQSLRFDKSRDDLADIFGKEQTEFYFRIPFWRGAVFTLWQLLSHPILIAGYLGILVYTKWLALFAGKPTVKWEQVLSSKNLNI